MDENEVITLSSDEDTKGTTPLEEELNPDVSNKSGHDSFSNTVGTHLENLNKNADSNNKYSNNNAALHKNRPPIIKYSSNNTASSSNCANLIVKHKDNPNNEELNQNLKIFTELVEYCGSLETNQNDRIRLTKKLMKRYGETDINYIKSTEFKNLILKCREKVNVNNLYLIAEEISEELSRRKKIIFSLVESNSSHENQKNSKSSVKINKKREKFIEKIIAKLDKLGSKIRKLEEKEVDLSDEEDSSYLLLQRYRERFCQIYERLCAYTNEDYDPKNRKIYFTESKYPAINKCIENWLNKTKKFPDFIDIMKLIESKSLSLGLPSNKEALKAIAEEIFPKVGAMLQRKRMYDLWDSLCGFLDDEKDPADTNPDLSQILKSNFETRLKKEQEIFQYFTELQEKHQLQPEEVADEEAHCSPVESGNEDDKEIEEIENCLNRKLDDAIKDDVNNENKNHVGKNSESDAESKLEQSKNNYKNCKSRKWRLENAIKVESNTPSLQGFNGKTENEEEKGIEGEKNKPNVTKKFSEAEDDSDIEFLAFEDVKPADKTEVKTDIRFSTPCKRMSTMKIENLSSKKRKSGDSA